MVSAPDQSETKLKEHTVSLSVAGVYVCHVRSHSLSASPTLSLHACASVRIHFPFHSLLLYTLPLPLVAAAAAGSAKLASKQKAHTSLSLSLSHSVAHPPSAVIVSRTRMTKRLQRCLSVCALIARVSP